MQITHHEEKRGRSRGNIELQNIKYSWISTIINYWDEELSIIITKVFTWKKKTLNWTFHVPYMIQWFSWNFSLNLIQWYKDKWEKTLANAQNKSPNISKCIIIRYRWVMTWYWYLEMQPDQINERRHDYKFWENFLSRKEKNQLQMMTRRL